MDVLAVSVCLSIYQYSLYIVFGFVYVFGVHMFVSIVHHRPVGRSVGL